MIQAPRVERATQKRILIVDDDEEFRGTLRDFVETLGYLCTEADSGPAALRTLKETRFPIIISDIVMPEMDGLELVCSIKKRYPDVDVLLTTGYKSQYSLSEILQAGACDLLAKPFGIKNLSTRIKRIERKRATRRRLSMCCMS
jgi:two-component system response regulator FlrC